MLGCKTKWRAWMLLFRWRMRSKRNTCDLKHFHRHTTNLPLCFRHKTCTSHFYASYRNCCNQSKRYLSPHTIIQLALFHAVCYWEFARCLMESSRTCLAWRQIEEHDAGGMRCTVISRTKVLRSFNYAESAAKSKRPFVFAAFFCIDSCQHRDSCSTIAAINKCKHRARAAKGKGEERFLVYWGLATSHFECCTIFVWASWRCHIT